MNEIAQSNWEKFVADEFEEPMQGHLLRYPIDVGQDGTVSNLTCLFYLAFGVAVGRIVMKGS